MERKRERVGGSNGRIRSEGLEDCYALDRVVHLRGFSFTVRRRAYSKSAEGANSKEIKGACGGVDLHVHKYVITREHYFVC